MEEQNKALEYEDILQLLRLFVTGTEYTQDFIFLTGLYRFEYHHKNKTFVVEQRLFDRIELDPTEEEPELNNVPDYKKKLGNYKAKSKHLGNINS